MMEGNESIGIKDESYGNQILQKILHTDESHMTILARKGKSPKGLAGIGQGDINI